MRSVVLLLCCVPLLAATPAREGIEIPDLPSADMRISWKDFKELLHLIQPPAPETPEEDKKPPVPWSLQEVLYTVDATDIDAIRVEAVMQVFVWDDEWSTIPVLDAGSALDAARLNGDPSFLTRKDDQFVLFLDEPGAHRIEFDFFVPATRREGTVSIKLPAQPDGASKVSLLLAEPDAIVSAPAAASVRVRRLAETLEADLAFPSTDALAITWRLPAKPVPDEPEVPREPPRIASVISTIATVSDNFISMSSQLHFDVLRGETNAFTLRLPASVQVLAVEGKGVSWDTFEEDGSQRVEVGVNHAIDGRYALEVRYEAPAPDTAATLELPRLDVDGMTRQRGYLAIATDGNVEIHAGDEGENITRVDLSDLPTELIARSMNPILHAFQYNRADFLLPLDFRRLQDVPVRVATIDRARITSVVTPEGMLVQRAQYIVRNHHKKFLRVEIGEDAEVWTAHVAGELVRPARDGDDAAVLLPLRKSNPQAPGGGAFSVELTWMQRIVFDNGWRTRIALAAPRTDLMANEVKWDVFLPEDRVVFRSSGDITAIDDGAQGPAVIHLARDTFSRTEAQRIHRLREGIERFLITDINNPAASAMAQSRTFEDAIDTTSARPRADVQVAGVLPVDMPLPRVGRPHYFERTIVQEGVELELIIETYHARLRGMLRFLAAAAVFGAGFAAARLMLRRLHHARALGIALAALVIAAWLAPAYAGLAAAPLIRWACLGAGLGIAMALAPMLARYASVSTPQPADAPQS